MICTACPYHEQSRCNAMPGRGDSGGIMFLGEAPAAEEENLNKPFVGRAGRLLDDMIADTYLDKYPLFFTNAIRCRVHKGATKIIPIGRLRICRDTHLLSEVERVRPKVIIALGATPASSLKDRETRITRVRGTWGSFRGIPVLYTYHPAYVLRDPSMLGFVLDDFLSVGDRLSGRTNGQADKVIRYHHWTVTIPDKRLLSVDCETNGRPLYDPKCRIYLVAVAWSDHDVVCFDLRFAPQRKRFTQLMRALGNITFGGHNVTYDLLALDRFGYLPLGCVLSAADSIIAFALKHPRYPNMGLKHLAPAFCKMESYESPIDFRHPYVLNEYTPGTWMQHREYCSKDAIASYRLLGGPFQPTTKVEKVQYAWLNSLNLICARMSKFGLKVDTRAVKSYDFKLKQEARRLHRRLSWAANLTSTKSIADYVYGRLKLPVLKTTPSGQPSLADDVLAKLAPQSLWVRRYRRYNEIKQVRTRYTKPLMDVDEAKLLHPQARVARYRDESMDRPGVQAGGTATGRVAFGRFSTIPRGADIKRFFITRYGVDGVMVVADYKTNEVRVLADLSKDEYLCSVFADGKDIHLITAAEILGKKPKDVTAEERQNVGKRCNFALIYGAGPETLLSWIKAGWPKCTYTVDDTARFEKRLKQRMPQATAYMDELKRKAIRDGYVDGPTGRRFPFPNARESAHERRAAANAVIQNGSAECCNMACYLFAKAWHPGTSGFVCLTVYDSLIADLKYEAFKKWGGADAVSELMTTETVHVLRKLFGWNLSVPLAVDISVSRKWGA